MRLIVPVVGQYGHEVETGKNTRRDWRINEAFPRLLLGERDSALALLDEAVHDEPSLRAQIIRLPWFATLHGDPRFERLTKQP